MCISKIRSKYLEMSMIKHFHDWELMSAKEIKQKDFFSVLPRQKLSLFVASQRKSQGGVEWITIIFLKCKQSLDKLQKWVYET